MSKGKTYIYSTLICKECGLRVTIPRPKSFRRKEGHIKTMYCARCGQDSDHVEDNYFPWGWTNEQ